MVGVKGPRYLFFTFYTKKIHCQITVGISYIGTLVTALRLFLGTTLLKIKKHKFKLIVNIEPTNPSVIG